MSGALLTAPQFIAKWHKAHQTERASAHQHFLDLCSLLEQPTPATADPAGKYYAFEKRVDEPGGRRGFADVWKRGYFAWEYKRPKEDLTAAYRQLLQYREPLENPPLLIVCDIERYEIHTNFTGTAKQVHAFRNDDLVDPEPLRILRNAFERPERLRPGTTVTQVTEEAAGRFATLADALRRRGIAAPRAAHFLTQLLFCLFAEDIGLLARNLFTQVLERSSVRPESFRRHITTLFEAMREGGEFYLYDVTHFNGGLFADIDVVDLEPDELRVLLEEAKLDWSAVETAVMGTLFERSLDPGKRAQLGAHYTGRYDILRIVEPVLLAPLRREWADVRAQLDRLREPTGPAASTEDARKRRRQAQHDQQTPLKGILTRFKQRLAEVRVLDPAAGSGNFLSVALAELLRLEKDVIVYGALAKLPFMFPDVSPRQMYGLEINPYAHELAQVSVWMTYLQWLAANGFRYERKPVLQTLDTIRLMDAILDRSDPTQARRPCWPKVDVIVSNPPYLGGKRLRTELGDAYIEDLFAAYAGEVPREVDYVCYFFEQARRQIAGGQAGRAGLLATQGIRGGANRKVLERIKQSGDIFWAESDRDWVLDGATVHISMVAFDNGTEHTRTLNGVAVSAINANLTSALDLTTAYRLKENQNVCFMGVTPAGSFDVSGDLARQWLLVKNNPNGRPNVDVVRPYYNGIDLTRRPRDVWIVDFGVGMSQEAAALYEAPFEHVRDIVKPERAKNNRAIYRDRWWIHAESRPAMRKALAPLQRYIGTSMVAKHRLFSWVPSRVLPANLLIIFARQDDYFFGVLHSKAHRLWAQGTGTQLREAESGLRYTPTSTFETFCFPWPLGSEPASDPRVEAIARAARELVEKRDRWLNPEGAGEAELKRRTLTNLYNSHPTWLDLAHRKLDQAVLDAYGWPHELGDDQILARLLALNLERAVKTPAVTLPGTPWREGTQVDKQPLPVPAD